MYPTKQGIVDFAKALASHNIEILSTGGTYRLLKEEGVDVIEVSEHTGFPEIMDGRVKKHSTPKSMAVFLDAEDMMTT